MGLAGGHKDITHSLGANKKLALHDLFQVAVELKKTNNLANDRSRPAVDVDASWIARLSAFTNRSKPQIAIQKAAVETIIAISTVLSNTGFDVNIVCDNPLRHHSKRATTPHRQADRQRTKFKNLMLHHKLSDIKKALQEIRPDLPAYQQKLQHEKSEMEHEILKTGRNTNASSVDVGQKLYLERLPCEAGHTTW
jgi:hypothetical protein